MTKYFPVAENSEICRIAVEFFEKREVLLSTIEAYPYMHEFRGECEAWVRVGRWIKTGRVMP